MTLNELKDKRNKLLHDAQNVLLGENVDGEKRSWFWQLQLGSSAISVQNYGARGALSAIGLAKYGSTRQRRSWKLARPYILRFTSLSRLTWPST